MSTATQTPAASNAAAAANAVQEATKAPKISAGDAAIAAAQKPGAKVSQLLKAVWSTRGNVKVQVENFEFGVAIIKADLTKMLQALPQDAAAPFLLMPIAGAEGGADLIPVAKETAEV